MVVSLRQQKLGRIPLHNLEAIQTFGWSIYATPQLMEHCAKRGIRFVFCNPSGKFMCYVGGYAPGNVLLRRSQYRIADTADASLSIAREMIAAKILNARTIIQRFIRDYPRTALGLEASTILLARSVRAARSAQSASELLGIEGNAAECYFSSFSQLLLVPDFQFAGRVRRPPTDPVNALLSFAYSLLTADCRSALESVGLDSAVGFFHKDRPGRPSLALDLMEEFRAPLADRHVLSLLNRKQIKISDFRVEESGAVRLSDEARRLVLTTWQERKKEMIMHPFLREKMTIGMLPHVQARLLAHHVRNSLDAYPPMLWK